MFCCARLVVLCAFVSLLVEEARSIWKMMEMLLAFLLLLWLR